MDSPNNNAYVTVRERSMYRTRVSFTRGLYSFYVFSIVGVSLKFGGITLMSGGLYSREVCDRERVKLTRVRYIER